MHPTKLANRPSCVSRPRPDPRPRITETPSPSVGERLAAAFDDATHARRDGLLRRAFSKVVVIPPARDIRAEAKCIVPNLQGFSSFLAPAGASRGDLVRGLVPLLVRLGVVEDETLDVARTPIETVRLLGALADVLVTWEGDRRVIEPRFVLVGADEPTDDTTRGAGGVRGHVVVLDPLGSTGEPGFGATLVWLSGVRVGHVRTPATLP